MLTISIITAVLMYVSLIATAPKVFLFNKILTPCLIISIFLCYLMISAEWYWIVTIYSILHIMNTIKLNFK